MAITHQKEGSPTGNSSNMDTETEKFIWAFLTGKNGWNMTLTTIASTTEQLVADLPP